MRPSEFISDLLRKAVLDCPIEEAAALHQEELLLAIIDYLNSEYDGKGMKDMDALNRRK